MMNRPVGQSTFNPEISKAAGYQRWIFDLLEPSLGKRVLEIGVGSAPFVPFYRELSDWYPADIDPKSVEDAIERGKEVMPQVVTNGVVGDAGDSGFWERAKQHPIDSIIAVNVLEHVEDDRAFFTYAFQLLPSHGKLGLFVPALPSIYGSMDRSAGHFRRYTKRQLVALAKEAGFVVEHVQYVNAPGILYWWWRGRVRKTTDLSDPLLGKSISRIDRYAVPIIRFFEDRTGPPLGQSLLIRLDKPVV